MFARAHTLVGVVALLLVVLALTTARPSQGGLPEERHVVQAGETLWAIAAERYPADPRAGIWRIEQRNGLHGDALQPGTVLFLPS